MAVPLIETLQAALLEPLRTGLNLWVARTSSQLGEDPLQPLPADRALALRRRIEALPPPAPLITFLREELTAAVEAWRCDPREAPNVLIVLSRPVQPVAPLIGALMAGWTAAAPPARALLPCRHRPADPEALPLMLEGALEDSLPQEDSSGHTALLTLAGLDQCFLRCIGGWGGIERLRQVILERPDLFWLLGCNSWAWTFLDQVCQISSYLPSARFLPALGGSELQDWLAPVVRELGLHQDGPPRAGRASGDPAVEAMGQDPWAQLANLSAGSGPIAAALFVEALRLDPDDEKGPPRLVSPALSDLPTLTDEDRYVLHSLLIHGTLQQDHLAFGLGLPSHLLQPRLHALLAQGVIANTAGELSVRPSHYLSLVKDLANNNFFTGEA